MNTGASANLLAEAAKVSRFIGLATQFVSTCPSPQRRLRVHRAIEAIRTMEQTEGWPDRWREHPAVLRVVMDLWVQYGAIYC